jgi:hypothetical protein
MVKDLGMVAGLTPRLGSRTTPLCFASFCTTSVSTSGKEDERKIVHLRGAAIKGTDPARIISK